MDNKSPRELLEVPATWSITQVLASLSAALEGNGPALAFGRSDFTTVESEIAVVIPTSGSSGAPKEVALSAAALLASATAAHKFLGAKKGECWSLALPTQHIAGVNVLVRAIALGSDITQVDFDYTSIVPTQLYRALGSDTELLASLQDAKAVLVGGAAVNNNLLQEARVAGINVVTTYGMSEMSGGCVYNNEPLAGVDVEIRDDHRIALRGPMQALGYLNSPERLSDESGWFLTNDSGYVHNGKLYIEGRIDDQIISGGEKISLSAIDNFLNLDGLHYMSCAINDPEWGQQLCLASSGAIEIEIIKAILRERFGNHGVPKKFISNINLPVTLIGKPDRATLAQRFERIES
ncbi:MAG TPA: AMP-binding protein [Candidatus Nanopelagicaceae bacterium]